MNILHITPAYYPATYWGGPIFSVYALNNDLAVLPGAELKVLNSDVAAPGVVERMDTQGLEGSTQITMSSLPTVLPGLACQLNL